MTTNKLGLSILVGLVLAPFLVQAGDVFSDAQTLALTVNGAAEPVATFVAAASDGFQVFKAKIPASALRSGDNVITLSSSATGGKTAYLGVDFVRLETFPYCGMALFLR